MQLLDVRKAVHKLAGFGRKGNKVRRMLLGLLSQLYCEKQESKKKERNINLAVCLGEVMGIGEILVTGDTPAQQQHLQRHTFISLKSWHNAERTGKPRHMDTGQSPAGVLHMHVSVWCYK